MYNPYNVFISDQEQIEIVIFQPERLYFTGIIAIGVTYK